MLLALPDGVRGFEHDAAPKSASTEMITVILLRRNCAFIVLLLLSPLRSADRATDKIGRPRSLRAPQSRPGNQSGACAQLLRSRAELVEKCSSRGMTPCPIHRRAGWLQTPAAPAAQACRGTARRDDETSRSSQADRAGAAVLPFARVPARAVPH